MQRRGRRLQATYQHCLTQSERDNEMITKYIHEDQLYIKAVHLNLQLCTLY